jgi:hypothetical protein
LGLIQKPLTTLRRRSCGRWQFTPTPDQKRSGLSFEFIDELNAVNRIVFVIHQSIERCRAFCYGFVFAGGFDNCENDPREGPLFGRRVIFRCVAFRSMAELTPRSTRMYRALAMRTSGVICIGSPHRLFSLESLSSFLDSIRLIRPVTERLEI